MYKLLTQDMKSHRGFQWEINKEYRIDKHGNELCSDQVFHCYSHPILAILLNPIHANIDNPRLFEIEVDAIVNDDGLKYGTKIQKLVRELEVPQLDIMTKVDFSIRIAMEVYKEQGFTTWADNFLNRIDTTEAAARAAAWAAWAAAEAAAEAAAWAARAAARAAAEAAETDMNPILEKVLKDMNLWELN